MRNFTKLLLSLALTVVCGGGANVYAVKKMEQSTQVLQL